MRGTSNTTAEYVDGNTLPADSLNDIIKDAVSSDDDRVYDLFDIEPPPGASDTVVSTGFVPLREGFVVQGEPGSRLVYVNPIRVFRSSRDTVSPREVLSAVSEAQETINMPTIATAGNWKMELLYAQLSYLDAASPTKGSVVTFQFATSPANAATGGAPNFATLPANTDTTWNIPLAYVKNVAAATAIAQEDIIDFPPAADADSFTCLDTQKRMVGTQGAGEVRRAYADAENNPTRLVVGGASKWVTYGTNQTITSVRTSVSAGRYNVERVSREILIPPCSAATTGGTAGTGAAAIEDVVLDDTRDWRNANFRCEWWIGSNGAVHNFAEDDNSLSNRVFPCVQDSGATTALFITAGQSWANHTPNAAFGARLWVGVVTQDTTIEGSVPVNTVVNLYVDTADDGWGIYVHPTTGFLRWYAKRTGTASGPPIWILLDAWFANH